MLVVTDASVLVPSIADDGPAGDAAREWLVGLTGGHQVHLVRSLTQLELLSALRGLAARGAISEERAETASRNFLSLPAQRHDVTQGMVARIWSLRKNLGVYDAAYVALVERLFSDTRELTVLATADQKLAKSPGLSIDIRTFVD